jgi:arabinofuranosyltransferase
VPPPPSPNLQRRFRLQVAGLVLLVLGYVAHFRLLDARIQDDAYISFRYAKHLAEGHGLVWNIGEKVEGYTNFLWTVLAALPLAISDKLNPLSYARALSSFSGYITIVVTFLFMRHLLPKTRVFPLIPIALLAGSWPLAINTMTGLETVFFGALLTSATFLLVREQDDLKVRGSSLLYALAALTRPEAILLFAFVSGLVFFHRRNGGAPAKNYAVRFFLPFVLLVGAHEIFRLAYYGEFVPNTYFAKFGSELPAGMPTRATYIGDFLLKGLDPAVITPVLVVFLAIFKGRELRAQILLLTAGFGLLNVALSGADFMIGFRYLVPYAPAFYMAATLSLEAFSERVRKGPSARTLEVGAFVFALLAGAHGYWHSRTKLQSFEQLRQVVNHDTNTALGKWMAESLPRDAVVVARDIGEIGYLSGLPLIDMTGLTDRTIARKPGNVLDRAFDIDDIFARHPSVFVFVSKLPGPTVGPRRAIAFATSPSTLRLLDDPRFAEQFMFFTRYPNYERLRPGENGQWVPASTNGTQPGDFPNTYFLEVYLRKDLVQSLQK